MRWLGTSINPDVYEEQRADEKKKWAGESAMSHFLAGIESRVLGALEDHCKDLCNEEVAPDLVRISLQFGGGEILLMPFPENSESSAESAIKEKSGFDVNVAGKAHRFPIGHVFTSEVPVERRAKPRVGSIPYDNGNCMILSIFRLVGSSDLCRPYEEVGKTIILPGREFVHIYSALTPSVPAHSAMLIRGN